MECNARGLTLVMNAILTMAFILHPTFATCVMNYLISILQSLDHFDHWLFKKINGQWTNSFFDFIFLFFRQSYLWIFHLVICCRRFSLAFVMISAGSPLYFCQLFFLALFQSSPHFILQKIKNGGRGTLLLLLFLSFSFLRQILEIFPIIIQDLMQVL